MHVPVRVVGPVAAVVTVLIWSSFIVIARQSAQHGLTALDMALQRIVDVVLAVEGPGLPRALTFFEVLTLAALVAFAEAGVEVMVLAAGMGGRLDATCVVPASVTLMTPIALDH